MEQSDPDEASSTGPESPGAAYEALRRLEERLDRASDAAERLLREAALRASGGAGQSAEPEGAPSDDADSSQTPRPPPAGWQARPSDDDRRGAGELELLANIVRSLRDLIPPELQQRLAEAMRELLMALRALIDWYLERVDQRRPEPAEVQDIPIL